MMIDSEKENRQKKSFSAEIAFSILWVIFTVAVTVLYFAVRYLMDNWAELSADELVYHLKSTLSGTNPEMIRDAVLHYVLPAAILAAVLIGIRFLLRNGKRTKTAYMAGVFLVEIVVLISVKKELDDRIGLTDYIRWNLFHSSDDFVAENYVDPGNVKIEFPEKKRNLIYIFMESMEMTFADRESGGRFEKNIIPELTELAQTGEDFSGEESVLNGGIPLPGAPLKVPVNGNTIQSEEQFFQGMESLGTILEKQGYRQELLIGSDAKFGGRDLFYRGHGNFEIRDYSYALENGRIPEGYKVFWGYEDEKLFNFAREDLEELAKGNEPFNLTMLTVDTHFEDGYRCRLCRDDFGEQYADAFACSSRQVTEFVRWVQQQDFYEDTVIVICGDHLTMDKDFCKDVPEDYLRKTYVTIINGRSPDRESAVRKSREYSTMDLFPTTLAAMGVQIDGHRLGMGTDLYSDEKTLIEKYGLSECELQLSMPSAFMDRMSGIRITEDVLASARKNAYIRAKEYDDGRIMISLHGVGNAIDHKYIDKVELEIRDKKTGDKESFEVPLNIGNKNNPTQFNYPLEFDSHGRSLEDIEAIFYISSGGFEHYEVADLEHSLKK